MALRSNSMFAKDFNKNIYKPMYGISESKQRELQALTDQVQAADYKVQELQALVDALTEKSNTYQGFLADAEADRETALANLDMLKTAANAVDLLANNSAIVNKHAATANALNDKMASEVAMLVDKVIFSADMINRFSDAINKKKALNPLIPDALIARMAASTESANKAVAAMLTALQSCYTATATSSESMRTLDNQLKYADFLKENLTGQPTESSGSIEIAAAMKALTDAEGTYKDDLKAYVHETGEFDKKQKKYSDLKLRIEKREQLIHETMPLILEWEEKELDARVQTLQHDLIRLKEDADELEKDVDESTITEFEYALEVAALDYEKLRAANEIHRKTINDCNKEIGKLQKELFDARDKRNDANNAMDAARTKYLAAKEAFDDANQNLEQTMAYYAQADDRYTRSIEYLIALAYRNAVEKHKKEMHANNRVTKELDAAEKKLVVAQNKLSSLQAGLAAATAAALAA